MHLARIMPMERLSQTFEPIFLEIEETPIELPGDNHGTRTVAGVIPFILSPAVVEKREDGNECPVSLEFICQQDAI